MRRGFGFHDRHSPFRFNPATMFSAGQPGAVYDISDLSTMFTTSAGTTPVAMPGGGAAVSVGRMLDKSGNGNHAIAFNDTTARPELRARANLLTYSEEFDQGIWTKTVSTVTANTQIAPNGTLTADTLTASVGGGFHYINTTIATQAASYTYTICVKKGTSSWIFFGIFDSRLNYFNLDTGLFGSVTDTCVAQNLGNGWYRLTATGTVTAGSSGGTNIGLASGDGGGNFVAAGTETVHIWGSDFRFTNIGANVPAYQRIADANTYDTSGFPLYLFFDGIDDSMYTPANLDLSGTDKVSVFAGVRKLSDAAAAIISEFSASAGTNNGTLYFAGPTANGAADFVFASKGTTIRIPTATGLSAPLTRVISGIGDISGDLAQLRVNGAVAATETGDQGSGNYGTYPLFIGARNNASFRFNGQLYSLIVLGAQATDWQIWAAEQWMAQRTGISF